jgi:hypothetical protein
MVAVAVWLAVVQPFGRPGLVWGGNVYTSKNEFKRYLRSKSLSYATWLKRNPGVAPWEPGRRAATARVGSQTWDWKRDTLLAIGHESFGDPTIFRSCVSSHHCDQEGSARSWLCRSWGQRVDSRDAQSSAGVPARTAGSTNVRLSCCACSGPRDARCSSAQLASRVRSVVSSWSRRVQTSRRARAGWEHESETTRGDGPFPLSPEGVPLVPATPIARRVLPSIGAPLRHTSIPRSGHWSQTRLRGRGRNLSDGRPRPGDGEVRQGRPSPV